jgi:polyphosphate kinase
MLKLRLSNEKMEKRVHYSEQGNLNEKTAKVYTDYFLMTSNRRLTAELSSLFEFLPNRKKPDKPTDNPFSRAFGCSIQPKANFCYFD